MRMRVWRESVDPDTLEREEKLIDEQEGLTLRETIQELERYGLIPFHDFSSAREDEILLYEDDAYQDPRTGRYHRWSAWIQGPKRAIAYIRRND